MSVACKKVLLLTLEFVEFGTLWCGVLPRLNISALNLSSNRSRTGNLRSTPKSTLCIAGPRKVPVPQVPKRPTLGTAKADLSYHWKMFPVCCGAPMQSANWVELGEFR